MYYHDVVLRTVLTVGEYLFRLTFRMEERTLGGIVWSTSLYEEDYNQQRLCLLLTEWWDVLFFFLALFFNLISFHLRRVLVEI